MDLSQIEVRCPVTQRLMLKIGRPTVIDGANLIEVACRDCRNEIRKQGMVVERVVHRYNVLGDMLETIVT